MRRPLLAALTSLAVAATTAALGPSATAATAPDPVVTDAVVERLTQGPGGKVAPSLAAADGVITAFVELEAPSVLDVTESGGSAAARDAAEDRIEALARSVVPGRAAPGTTGPAPERISVTTTLVAGTVVRGDADQIRRLAESATVASVSRVIPKSVTNAGTNALTGALQAWQDAGRTGAGVRVGVVDTGLDYTHATFGGPGTPEAYAEAYGVDGTAPVPMHLVDRAKYLGGHDFAGPRYDAGGRPGTSPKARPDRNPIDPPATAEAPGHGTHVAGTGFGYGVLADGSTFRGDYGEVDDVSGWRIPPGSAPEAGVYALKVFGDGGGTTELTLAALDWAADPDRDKDVSDHLDVVNLSLGSDYTPADDPENLFVDRLADMGVLTVFSAGNSGDVTDIGGTSGNARSGLTVAWSVGDSLAYDAVEVTAGADPSLLGRHAAQASVNYTGTSDVTAPVTYLGPDVTGCEPLTPFADRVAGTIVYLAWDDDDGTRPCNSPRRWANAEAAGAVGVLLGSRLEVFTAAIGGNATLPGAQLTAASTAALLPRIVAGDLVLRMGPSLAGAGLEAGPARADTLSPASSRGVHGSLGIVKPDVAAPGQQVASAASGGGDRAVVRSGSSMAAPHVAGIAALVRQAHPGWTPAQVKAAVMNTATHDVHAGTHRSGRVFGPARVGAGRVDALAAVRTTTLAYAADDPALVSVSFGVVPVADRTVVLHRDVTVENRGDTAVEYATSFATATTTGGASVTTSPATVAVPAGERRTVTVTLTVDPATLAKDLDPTSSPMVPGLDVPRDHVSTVSGRLLLTSGDTQLRVPVQAAPRPVSDLSVQRVVLTQPGTTSAPLTLTGRGVDAGGWTSFAVPQQLVGTSPPLPAPTVDASPSAVASGDLRYVGFSSTAPLLAALGQDPRGGVVGIGIATEGEWANLGASVVTIVDTDVDRDGTRDFRTYVGKLAPGLDITVAETYDRAENRVEVRPVNEIFGDVDTTVFDSNVMVVPIALDALGVAEGQTPTFSVWTRSDTYARPGAGGVLDRVAPFTVDPYHPEYWFDGATPNGLLFPSGPGARLTVHRTADPAAEAADLLVLHTHNASPGRRAQVVDVAAPVAAPTTTTLSVSGDRTVGSPLTLTARVEPAAATGTVTFRDGDDVLATVPVDGGTASTSVSLASGSHRLTATFTPASAAWLASTSDPVTVVVAPASSSVRLRLSDRALAFGEPVTATAEITATGGSPTGAVEVRAGDRVLGRADVVVDGPEGRAVMGLPQDLPVGAHRLTAVYTGTADVAGATSEDVRVRVVAATPTVSLGTPTWTVAPGATPRVTVAVTGEPGAPPPTGTVTLVVNLRRLPPVQLGPDGTVRVTLPPVGRRATVAALYGGDRSHRPAFEIRGFRVR